MERKIGWSVGSGDQSAHTTPKNEKKMTFEFVFIKLQFPQVHKVSQGLGNGSCGKRR
jgi:hypothetical protein